MLTLPLVACSNNDQATFATADNGTTADPDTNTGAGSTETPGTDTTITTIDGTTTVVDGSAATTTAESGAVFPVGAEVVVDFTYEASGSGRILNPYIAVWVEDTSGNVVKTVSLWYEQSSKGAKYLEHLQRWSGATGESFDASVSGATRVAGSYRVAWDGTDDDGNPVAQGDYLLNIEASREHGPYELISESIIVSDAGFSIELTPNGELTAASATLSV